MEKITIYYFSPTGNAKYIAGKLGNEMTLKESSIIPMEYLEREDLVNSDHIIIIFSIHGFNPPRSVYRFVDKIPNGLYKEVSFIAVGCTDSWVNKAATLKLRNKMESKGSRVIADRVIALPLSFIVKFPIDLGRAQISVLNEQLSSIIKSINISKPDSVNIPFKSRIINFIGKLEDPASRFFGLELYANKNCISCGKCVRQCPEKNIKFNRNKRPVFGLKCIMCLRCVYICPVNVIKPRFARFIPIKGGYHISMYLDKSETILK